MTISGKDKGKSRKLSLGAGLLLSFSVSLICLLLAEIAIRDVLPPAPEMNLVYFGDRFDLPRGIFHSFLQTCSRTESSTGWFRSFKGVRYSRTKEHKVRIVCLGGSTTHGVYLPVAETWPYMLEKVLREKGYDAEVINAGECGYTTAHSLVNYTLNMRYYNPDVVIIMHAVNDLCRSFPRAEELPLEWDYGSYSGPMINILRQSVRKKTEPPPRHAPIWQFAVWRLIANSLNIEDPYYEKARQWLSASPNDPKQQDGVAVEKTGVNSMSNEVDVGLEQFASIPLLQAHLDYLVELCRNDGHEVILATQANIYTPGNIHTAQAHKYMREMYFRTSKHNYVSAQSLRAALEAVQKIVAGIGDKRNVLTLDVEKALDGHEEGFIDDFHLNAKGNAVVAGTLAEGLTPICERLKAGSAAEAMEPRRK